MKKVTILTFHFNQNYGAALQAYATQSFLKSQGYAPEFPAYVPGYMRPSSSPFRGIRHNGRVRPSLVWDKIKNIKRAYSFARFRKKYLKICHSANTLSESRALQASSHAVVVGSDQVWNLNWIPTGSFDGYFFLDGVLKNETGPRKISYAACFGTYDQPRAHLDAASKLIGEFDAIFTRNSFTARIINENTLSHSELVVDPTLLPNVDWNFGNHKPLVSGKYIFVYSISEQQKHLAEALIVKMKSETGYKVVRICSENSYEIEGCDKVIKYSGPDEWVNLIRHAEYVITDSFHGCVFAIKFSRKFFAYALSWRAERIVDLLKGVQLEKFLFESVEGIESANLKETDQIDWDGVSKRIRSMSEASGEKFMAALGA
jgi:hypothetical protein